jgi:hypothetical protein
VTKVTQTGRNGGHAPFHLILAESNDATALQVCAALRHVGAPAVFATPGEIVMAPYWSHDPFGATCVRLASGIEITDHNVITILNRIRYVSPVQFCNASKADQIYASEEFFALLVSWLAGFGGRVANRPHPGHIAGHKALSPLEDRLSLSEMHAEDADQFAAASRSARLPSGRPLQGYPDKVAPAGPGYPAYDPGSGPFEDVLVAGKAVARDDLPPGISGQIHRAMEHRSLSIARAMFTPREICALDPLPQARSPREVGMMVNHLLSIAKEESAA